MSKKAKTALTTRLKDSFVRFRAFINKYRKMSLVTSGGVLVALFIGMAYWASVSAMPGPIQYPLLKIVKKDPNFYSPLTGRAFKTKGPTKRPVTAIMIENSVDARPQSGIKQADLVYEAVAEGGITRLLALYQESQPANIGPVRSLRPYYVDWLTPYNASVVHVGGSRKALNIVRGGGYRDLDQFFNESSYHRISERYPPHNVYTNFKKINALNKQKKYTSSSFTGFARKDAKPDKKQTAKKINVTISSTDYNSSYVYNKKSNHYVRSIGGQPHKDQEKGTLTPKVIVVLKTERHTVEDDGPRENYRTTGKGTAHVFQNGSVKKVTWSKKNRKAPLKLTDSEGKDVELVRGQTWISAISKEGGVSWRP